MAPVIGYSRKAASASNGNDANTVLLLHMDGADASATFTDSAIGGAAPHTVTRGGSPTISTAQSEFGGSSGLLGTSNYLILDGSTDFAFGTADFTIDFWLRTTNISGIQALYDGRPNGGAGFTPLFYLNGQIISYATNGADVITSADFAIVINTWYHIALVRSSGTTRVYKNGTQVGSDYADSNTYVNSASRPFIGANGNNNGGNFFVIGNLDEYRISKSARWTTNFTPPVAAYS